MTQPQRTSVATTSSGTVIFSARFRRKAPGPAAPVLKSAHDVKRFRSWLALFVILMAIVVPPTLAAFTAIFALWLFGLSLALALIISVDLARRSIRWARAPVPA